MLFRSELAIIPPLLRQAQTNLTGNARDLWMAGIGTIKQQAKDLEDLDKKTDGAGRELKGAIRAAHTATDELVAWLERQAPSKTGPSGIGKENYTWSLLNVHLIPLTWEDEVAILDRELARAHAGLRFEEQRNRGLPQITPAANAEEYAKRANDAVTRFVAFLKEKDILAIQPYTDSALRAQIGEFVPLESRNFFAIASHLEPNTLYTHFYHWWDLAQVRESPHQSPLRRGPLLYNLYGDRKSVV